VLVPVRKKKDAGNAEMLEAEKPRDFVYEGKASPLSLKEGESPG